MHYEANLIMKLSRSNVNLGPSFEKNLVGFAAPMLQTKSQGRQLFFLEKMSNGVYFKWT